MLNKLKKSNQKGFTIIEVMIVLAIAGLIILIVLLAVPALQRNSRNTAIKNDASAITAAISEFKSNNDGALPAAANSALTAGGTVTLNNATPGTPATAKVQGSTAYTDGTGAPAAAVTPAVGNLYVYFGAKCPATVTGVTVQPTANTRSTAVVYAIESASSTAAKCIDS
jgi:prepilin-type N-terminal cleavage/methylation domain-containing protein